MLLPEESESDWPEQTGELLATTVTVGTGLTVTVTVFVPTHPLPVPLTV